MKSKPKNKIKRNAHLEWVRVNIKDIQLRVILYVEFGIKQLTSDEKLHRKLLLQFESQCHITISNPLTKAAIVLWNILATTGNADISTKRNIMNIYDLDYGTFARHKRFVLDPSYDWY